MLLFTLPRPLHTATFLLFSGLLLASATPSHAQKALTHELFEAPWISYNAGQNENGRHPRAIVAEDFDGDGFPDVAVSRARFGTGFTVLMNRGDGTYESASPSFYSSADDAKDILARDFNEDGHPDIVVANTGHIAAGSSFSLFPGNGDGTFQAPQSFTTGSEPSGVAAADFDGDDHLDLAVANHGSSTVSVFLGDGNGGFGPPTDFSARTSPFKLAAGDLNGDGAPDLAVANGTVGGGDGLTLLINDGSGSFSMGDTFDGNGGTSVAVADVDSDSDRDVLLGSGLSDTGAVFLFRNNGGGSLASKEDIPLVQFTSEPTDLALGDLDGDGWIDLVASLPFNGTAVALNDGAGDFGAATFQAAGGKTFGVTTADVDGDGDQDMLAPDEYSLAVTVHENPGDGQFPQPSRFPQQFGGQQLDLGDIDDDGDLDALSSGIGSGMKQPYILQNQGNGSFADGVEVPVDGKIGGQHGKLRDLNGDDLPDILVNSMDNDPPYDFFVALNQGNGTFGSYTRHAINACGSGEVDAFDIDADGDRDVIYAERLACQGIPDSGDRLFISENNGDGTFQAPDVVLAGSFASQFTARDFDEDGHLDLAVTITDAVALLLGNGDGTFQPAQTYSAPGGARDIVAADFDEDGHLDLATSNIAGAPNNENEESMSILPGNGDGSFGEAQVYYAPLSEQLGAVSGLDAGDADGDGDIDVMVSNVEANDVAMYLNDGDGQFSFSFRYGVGTGASSVHHADVTGDGRKDLVAMISRPPAVNEGANALTVLEHTDTNIPVELASLQATATGTGGVALTWQTASETNNARFEVERKKDEANHWTTVGSVEGAGTTQEPQRYRFTDDTLPFEAEVLRYRLKQIDLDGTFEYSPVVEAHLGAPSRFRLHGTFPNPFRQTATIRYELPKAGKVTLAVFDALGRKVRMLVNERQAAGRQEVTFEAQSLASGTYFVRLTAGDFTDTRPMVLVR